MTLEQAIEKLSETARQYALGAATLQDLQRDAQYYTEAAIDALIEDEP
jgi:hypothetical protein